MDIILSTNRKFKRMFANILSIVIILTMAFPVTGVANAQDPAPRVGLVLTAGATQDNDFNWMAQQGLQQAVTNLGISSSIYQPGNQSGYAAALQECADENDLCIAVGFEYGVSLANAARDNPDTKQWAIIDYSYPDCWEGANEGVDCGSFTELANVRGLKFNEKQAGYLAGVLAGATTISNVVGVVGGMDIPPVVAFVEGYRNGAQCTNSAVNVLSMYTGTFVDPGVGASTAQAMIGQGADVIFGAAGLTGNGAILYSAQNGKWAIGVDTDQYSTVFGNGTVTGSDHILSSAMKRADTAVYQAIADYVTGNFSGGTVIYDLAMNGVGLASFHETTDSIPLSVKDKLEIVKQGIIDGMVNIDTCPWLIAFPENDAVEGWEWPEGATVTLTIDNAPDFAWSGMAAVTTWGDPRTYVRIEFGNDYNLQIGDKVTLTDEFGTTITHTVQNLSVTNADVIVNVVGGKADSGATVQVWPHETGQQLQSTTVDGNWQVDFTGLFDLAPGTCGRSQITVGVNATAVDWCAPKPWLIAFPENDAVEGWEWPVSETVTLTIDNAPAGFERSGVAEVTSWGDPRTYIRFDFADAYDLKIGDTVTLMGEDGTTRTHIVQNLSVTDMNANTDTITGIANISTQVTLWPHGHDQTATVQTMTDEYGMWSANFTSVGFNLVPGIGGRSEVGDEAGNWTAVDWNVPLDGWKQINESGFGDSSVQGITSLSVFRGQLYAGTANWAQAVGGQVWRWQKDGTWQPVTEPGFGRGPANAGVLDLFVFQGQLYAATGWNGEAPGQVWRSADGTKWQSVTLTGFNHAENIAVTNFVLFKDMLYAGTGSTTSSAQIWRSSTGTSGNWQQVAPDGSGLPGNVTGFAVYKNILYAAIEPTSGFGAPMQVWRSINGSDWTTVTPDGFGYNRNESTGGFAQFGGYLYLGTRNDETGAQLWRTKDGKQWDQVIVDGFGDINNIKIESLLVYNDLLYAVTYNPPMGLQLWRSIDGLHWEQVAANGFGDGSNASTLWNSATTEYQGQLLIGTWNNNEGGEIWMFNP